MEKIRNFVCLKVYGKYALFSDPITRPGGEKLSYQTPTYQALKGILESIYWKPTFIWYIDKVRVMKKIQMESKGVRTLLINPRKDKRCDLSFYTYLKDIEYQVVAHFEWNENRPDLSQDRNEHKHHNIALRAIEQGGRRDVFLGTRECQAYVAPCEFNAGEGYYDDYGNIEFGTMFHSFGYPDETGKSELSVRLWKQVMKDGVIQFPRPDEITLIRKALDYGKDYKFKQFNKSINFTPVEEGEVV